eukprot:3789508-Rhodomonas_salina.2
MGCLGRFCCQSGGAPSTAVPKLVYFDARGVVEPIRLMLAAAGADYEDFRYKVDMSLKPPVSTHPVFSGSQRMHDMLQLASADVAVLFFPGCP